MLRRLKAEKKRIEEAILKGELIGVYPISTLVIKDKKPVTWIFTIDGAVGSCYEGGVFKVQFIFPDNYPYKPPSIQFLTKVWHTLFRADCNACFEILKYRWSPALTTSHLLKQLLLYLEDPGITTCCSQNTEAKRQYKEENEKFITKAKEWTIKHAMSDED